MRRRPPPTAPAPVPNPIQILLADDHWVVRAGLRAFLDGQSNLRVVGEAATGEEAVEKTRSLKPDVVLMDLVMPGIGGLEAVRRIAGLKRGTKVLVLEGGRQRVRHQDEHTRESHAGDLYRGAERDLP